MSGVGSCETGLDSLFASKPVGPGFEPCLGQSAKLAGAPKPLCLSPPRVPPPGGKPKIGSKVSHNWGNSAICNFEKLYQDQLLEVPGL